MDLKRARRILFNKLDGLIDALEWEEKGNPQRSRYAITRATFNPNNASCKITKEEFTELLAEQNLKISDLTIGRRID